MAYTKKTKTRMNLNSHAPHIDDCQSCDHRSTSDLCHLTSAETTEYKEIRRAVLYQSGQFVFYEGHTALGLYVLCSGRVKLTRLTARGQRRLVALVDPGGLIEKHTFQDGAVHEVTCEALEPSRVCVIDRVRYLDLLERNGALAIRVIKMLSREMGHSFGEADQLAFASARERMAHLLLELGERYGEISSEGTCIAINLKREELAQMAAITVETAVRILHAFQEHGLIHMDGRNITILKPDRLTKAARRLHSV